MSRRGFTLLELLVAMAMFAVLGTAIVALLAQGLNVFSEGTSATSMQDRLQAVLPILRDDLSAMQPPESAGVPPPIVVVDSSGRRPDVGAPAEPPANRLRSGWVKLVDASQDTPPAYYVALTRTNGRESEDPQLREAGTTARASETDMKAYEPATVDSGVVGNMLAPGGLLEVVWIAIPDDPEAKGVLTLYRLFRAPPGGPKSIVEPKAFDSIAKVHALGRAIQEGVLDFRVTFRNVFATTWDDGRVRTGRIADGDPYVGAVWDSTRALDDQCPLFRSKDSVGDVRDDVFPSMARLELTLVPPGPFGFGRGETTLLEPVVSPEETRVRLDSFTRLVGPGASERWFKVGTEWMGTSYDQIDLAERRAVVRRGQRGTPAREHSENEPVYVGTAVSTDVTIPVFKDKYVRRR
jgi:prepilin-type N-terminal cleavage/methylation domain-containing protein